MSPADRGRLCFSLFFLFIAIILLSIAGFILSDKTEGDDDENL